MKNSASATHDAEIEDIKYSQMCCGAHVTVGTQVICILNMIFFAFISIYHLTQISSTPISIAFIATIGVITFIIYGLGFYGVQKIKPKLLIPMVILLGFHVIYSLVDNGYMIFKFLTTGKPKMLTNAYFTKNWPFNGNESSEGFYVILFSLIARLLFYVLFTFWLFSVVFRCYQFLVKKVKAKSLPNHLRPEV
uniref:Uncharacterized protein n=1 Tax=Panagrolaimus sp. ES5 TaxID=591445 RepID=A0AC34F1I0_9BILA